MTGPRVTHCAGCGAGVLLDAETAERLEQAAQRAAQLVGRTTDGDPRIAQLELLTLLCELLVRFELAAPDPSRGQRCRDWSCVPCNGA